MVGSRRLKEQSHPGNNPNDGSAPTPWLDGEGGCIAAVDPLYTEV
jgi:hypothetical protein